MKNFLSTTLIMSIGACGAIRADEPTLPVLIQENPANISESFVPREEEVDKLQFSPSAPIEDPSQNELHSIAPRAEEIDNKDESYDSIPNEQTRIPVPLPETETPQIQEPSYARVNRAPVGSTKDMRNKKWQNVLIAAGAVVIAIVALTLVHHHAGHSGH